MKDWGLGIRDDVRSSLIAHRLSLILPGEAMKMKTRITAMFLAHFGVLLSCGPAKAADDKPLWQIGLPDDSYAELRRPMRETAIGSIRGTGAATCCIP